MADVEPVVDLVRQAMASAMLVILEDLNGFVAKLRDSDQSKPSHLFWTEDAEGFVKMRFDLVGAVECTLCPHGNDYDHNAERP